MHKSASISAVFLTLLLPSCFIPRGQAFYVSPQHATSNHYKTMPMVRDTLRSATYVGGLFTAGGANYRLRDGVLAFQGNIHQTRQWKTLQAFYGAGLSMGVYDIKRFTFPGSGVDPLWINPRSGSQFTGSFGLQGGLNFVVPFRSGEWRILCVEGGLQNEFGSYSRFRKDIPANAANLIERSNVYGSFGIHTDLINRFPDGTQLGIKLGYTQSFRKLTGAIADLRLSGYPRYMTSTLHVTFDRMTVYGQVNIGTDAANVQLGLVRRLFTENKPLETIY